MSAQEIDRFSFLPDHVLVQIISHLPTKLAAQTSVLSHRFQHLWETCSFLDLDLCTFQRMNFAGFYNLARCTLFERTPRSPLLCLRLCLDRFDGNLLPTCYIKSLIDEACILDLRHLTVKMSCSKLQVLLPHFFYLQFLESLSLSNIYLESPNISFPITLTHLKKLYLKIAHMDSNMLTHIIRSLAVLEVLDLVTLSVFNINLTSMTIRKLTINSTSSCYLGISIPSLEFLVLHIHGLDRIEWLELHALRGCSEWEVSSLKKAYIRLKNISKKNVGGVFQMLETISHVEELHLDIQESLDRAYPFDTLGMSTMCPPLFLHLRHVDLNICCHEHNIASLKSLLRHSPALETLNVVHKPTQYSRGCKLGRLWRSKLPRNEEGNYRYAYFKDLHIHDNKREVIRHLTKKQCSKRSKKEKSG